MRSTSLLVFLPLVVAACEHEEPPAQAPVTPIAATATPSTTSSAPPLSSSAARGPVTTDAWHLPPPPAPPPAPAPPGRRQANARCEANPCAPGDICVESFTGRIQVECLAGSFCGAAPTCACANLCGAGTCTSVEPAGAFTNGATKNARVTCSTGTLAP